MYVWPGVAAIWSALIAGLAGLVTYLLVDRGRKELLPLARTLYTAFAVSVLASSAILMTLLLQHRFDVSYVNSYSASDLPLHFLVSTFWAGQEGSFLLWCFWGSIIGLFVWRSAKEQEAPVMVVYLASFLGIIAILCKQSPFKLLPPPPPADGVGLNPLLQDPWMVIHPPVMFLGFASLSVPFSFAIAALWKKRWDGWITRALPWALLTFLTLGTAILMGGYWAYKTLGWGGYWGWDPVENTSLVPWLFTTALVHGMFLQRARKRHRKVNLFLACTAYAAILYGTFLTRSGVLADFSVHSFIDLGITGWLVAILATFVVLSLGMIAWRWRSIPKVEDEEPPLLSRSVLFILGIAVFCALAAVILLGTSAPILTRLGGAPSQVQTGFYGKTTTPAGFLLVLLAGLVPFVGWKGETGAALFKSSRRSLAVAAILTGAAFALGADKPQTLLLIFTAFFAADMNLRAVLRKASNGKLGGAGGYLAHVGVGIMLAGIVVSGAYAVSTRVNLPLNVPKKVGDTTLTFLRVVPGSADRKQAMEIRVEPRDGKSFYAYPKMYENSRTGQLMVNPSIRNHATMDLYIAPQQYDPGQPQVVGRDVRLTKGTTTSIDGVGYTLKDLNADRSAMMTGGSRILVIADLILTPPDGSSHDVEVRYTWDMARQEADAPSSALPGYPDAKARMLSVSPNDGSVILRLAGVSKNPKEEFQAATTESLSVDVTRKPLIALVWGGFYVMMAGGLLAFVKRAGEARRAVLEASPRETRAEPVVAATGPALPAHSRSTLGP
ncbi:MAG TPA: cytochrome c biogenesis protein CcsA [Thermoanaerobaculia bacterium]|nr:cytochrome c biogenesis protein CcsA [Thermoanaerobaculia bacterium]